MLQFHRNPIAALKESSSWGCISAAFMGGAAILDEPYKHVLVFAGVGASVFGILLRDPSSNKENPS